MRSSDWSSDVCSSDLVMQPPRSWSRCASSSVQLSSPSAMTRWRDRDPTEAVDGAPFVVRLKAPLDGETTIADTVPGAVTVQTAVKADFVMLRARQSAVKGKGVTVRVDLVGRRT